MIPLRDEHNFRIFPIWTLAIVLANAYVFYLELTATNTEAFILQYSLIPREVSLSSIGSLFPFISSQFLHAGFLHIISNMLFLWIFGDNIEAVFGRFFYPLFYLAAGAAAALTQYLMDPAAAIPMLGASGAVAGVLGAYFALFPTNKIKTLVFIFIFITVIDIPAWILLFYWFITQLFSGVAAVTLSPNTGGIAFLPHAGGFLFGWLTASFLLSQRRAQLAKFIHKF